MERHKIWGPFPLFFYHTLRCLPTSLTFRWKLRVAQTKYIQWFSGTWMFRFPRRTESRFFGGSWKITDKTAAQELRKWWNQGNIPCLDLLFLLYQDKRKARVYLYFFTVPFDSPAKAGYSGYVNVAKSSVKGLSKGAPLLKNDRFGDPSPRRRLPYGIPFFSSLCYMLKHSPITFLEFAVCISKRLFF